MPAPRGKMLGGSSGIKLHGLCARPSRRLRRLGRPWRPAGWSYADVLPYFRKIEDFTASNEIAVDGDAHGQGGPVSVGVRSPIIPAARDFVAAAARAGIPGGDYNGTRSWRRGRPSRSPGADQHPQRQAIEHLSWLSRGRGRAAAQPDRDHRRPGKPHPPGGNWRGPLSATGVEYSAGGGEARSVHATREIILSAGAVGSPHLLMLSGIGPRRELGVGRYRPAGTRRRNVGKHLKDHIQCAMFLPGPGDRRSDDRGRRLPRP